MTTCPQSLTIAPSVLYFGTSVALVSTLNPDDTPNLSVMSSAWALGNRIILGIGTDGHGIENLARTRECVISLPSADLWQQVESLAMTTGSPSPSPRKLAMGYRPVARKFELAGLTPLTSELVRPPRVAECPIQMEVRVLAIHQPTPMVGEPDGFRIIETRLERFHAHASIVRPGTNLIDTSRWTPLLYVFRDYFGTGTQLGKNFRAER